MPPPSVPPLNIPQNNNPGPSAMSAGDQGMLSPGGGSIRRAAPEPNKRALYVGGLDTRVTEDVLQKIFETAGHVQSVKIIPDKTVSLDLCLDISEYLLNHTFRPRAATTVLWNMTILQLLRGL